MENIYKIAIKHLNKEFGNLTKLTSDDIVYYVDDERKPLIYYHQGEKNGIVWINHDRIWSFFEDVFVFDYQQIRRVIKIWLEETYNLRGYIPGTSTFTIFEDIHDIK